MPKSTRSASPKRLCSGLDSLSAYRRGQRPKKAPKRVAFNLNQGAGGGVGGVGGGDEPSAPRNPAAGGGDGGTADGEGGKSSAPAPASDSSAPKRKTTPKETDVARQARKLQQLADLKEREEELLRHRQEQTRRQRKFRKKEKRRTRKHEVEEKRKNRELATAEEQAVCKKKERCTLQNQACQERLINDYIY
jgi:hypothetical protein